MSSTWHIVLVALPLLAVLSACGSKSTGATAAYSAKERDDAKRVFETVCFTCHGMQGAGDGPASAALQPKPRNLRDPAWQTSVNDVHIRNVITMGGAAVGKSPMMPAQPQLKNEPRVLEALVAHVRGLAKDVH